MKSLVWIFIIVVALGLLFIVFNNRDNYLPKESNLAIEENVSVGASIVGLWRSTEDQKYTSEFGENGSTTEFYEGGENPTSVGTWAMVDEISKNSPDSPDQPDLEGPFLQKIIDGEVYNYIISELTADSLVLIYLERGNTLNFTRIIEATDAQ